MRDNLLFFGIPEAIAPVHHGDGQATTSMEHSDEQGEQIEGARLMSARYSRMVLQRYRMRVWFRKRKIVLRKSMIFVKKC